MNKFKALSIATFFTFIALWSNIQCAEEVRNVCENIKSNILSNTTLQDKLGQILHGNNANGTLSVIDQQNNCHNIFQVNSTCYTEITSQLELGGITFENINNIKLLKQKSYSNSKLEPYFRWTSNDGLTLLGGFITNVGYEPGSVNYIFEILKVNLPLDKVEAKGKLLDFLSNSLSKFSKKIDINNDEEVNNFLLFMSEQIVEYIK